MACDRLYDFFALRLQWCEGINGKTLKGNEWRKKMCLFRVNLWREIVVWLQLKPFFSVDERENVGYDLSLEGNSTRINAFILFVRDVFRLPELSGKRIPKSIVLLLHSCVRQQIIAFKITTNLWFDRRRWFKAIDSKIFLTYCFCIKCALFLFFYWSFSFSPSQSFGSHPHSLNMD